jgi:GH43 family beta-xylosidase
MKKRAIIESGVPQLRDPCVVVKDGVYYMCGTGWHIWKNDTGNLAGGWVDLGCVAEIPEDAKTNFWAPEIHAYNGAYYMFTTYLSKKTGRRGCTVFRADALEGPYREISGGHLTPSDWDAIDATLYLDESGQPWMIFVHEWVCMPDKVGTMAAAKMSDDLTCLVSEPVELFRADAPSWAVGGVTDGCWMYRCADSQLLMLWSNWDNAGYCVGISRSASGDILGEWTHDPVPLYSKNVTGVYDGGHGMIFEDINGQMYLSIHSPNSPVGSRLEMPIFVPVKEKDGTLVLDM